MQRLIFKKLRRFAFALLTLCMGLSFVSGTAVASSFPPEQQNDAIGLEGTISTAPPSSAATIATPVNGANYTSLPVNVVGLCPKGLLVKVFSNNVFIGSSQCTAGSYSIPVDLFSGTNQLVARVYDALDQAGPDSNTVTVSFVDEVAAKFGTRISLSSDYAKKGADPGTQIVWPIILSGGVGPFAVSVDWGDGSPSELLSTSFDGLVDVEHTYNEAGVYSVIVKASDSTGTEAFLQLVGVADGAIVSTSGTSNSKSSSNSGAAAIQTKVLWWPAVAMVPLILATFWVGGRHQLFALRRELERNRNQGQ